MASLDVRPGVLGRRLAYHLLSRVTYNITPSRIDEFSTKTAVQAVNLLFDSNGSPPLWPDGPLVDNAVPIFSNVDYKHEPGFSYNGINKVRAVGSWRIYEAMGATNAKWKIIHYFSSIFSVFFINSLLYNFHYWRLLEAMAFSDLKTLALKITYDHNMLRYLNNNVNTEAAPNENYAREFLELFTIQKGQQQQGTPGNYTTYTEADIVEAAKVFSGIKSSINRQDVDPDTGIIQGWNYPVHHDQTDKVFSQELGGGATILGRTTAATMPDEVSDFVDLVFNNEATALSFVRKMYYFFVNDEISSVVEDNVIAPLATQLLNGYDHVAVLKRLFKSIHFYDEDDLNGNGIDDQIVCAKIKSPYELLCTTKNQLEAANIRNPNYSNFYTLSFKNDFNGINLHLESLGLNPRGPLTVEGYAGWNKESRSRNWFTSNYVYKRFTYGVSFRRGKVRNTTHGFVYKADMVTWVENNIDVATGPGTVQNPVGAANALFLVEKMLGYLLIELPVSDRLTYFQKSLLGGLSPINWYFVWSDYLTSGDDENVRIGIERLYDAILSSPEFQMF